MKPTIEDVAKEAGVSITTVSRVINNNYPVAQKTRKKVEDAIKKLDFTPNYLARGLIQKKTHTIGVLVPSITNLFFPAVVKGIERKFKDLGFTLFLCNTEGTAKEEKKHIKTLMERQVDGIIMIDPRTENIKNGYLEKITKEIPLVLVNGYHKGIRCNFVMNDQEMGTAGALEYLIELGHENIAFLRGAHSYSYDLKEEVYDEVLKKHQLPIKKENILIVEEGNSIETVDLSMEEVKKRLQENHPPTAIFACNDWMATGALNAAALLHISVPKQLSVIGYDNIVISALSHPKLTTVDQNMATLGETSADLLFEIIENENKDPKKIILNTTLIKRGSCGAI